MATKTNIHSVNFVTIHLQVCAKETQDWHDTEGTADMTITLPASQCGSDVFDLNKIAPALVTMARNDFFDQKDKEDKKIKADMPLEVQE